MAKKNSKVLARRRMVFLGLGCIAVIVVMTFSISKIWVEIIDRYRQEKELDEELIVLKEKEEELRVKVDKYQNLDYIAKYAREKYFYSKDGEFNLQIPEE